MTPREMTLDIAVNLGRIARFCQMGNGKRAEMFLNETKALLDLLEFSRPQGEFKTTIVNFRTFFDEIFPKEFLNEDEIDRIFEWEKVFEKSAR